MSSLNHFLKEKISKRKEAGLFRTLTAPEGLTDFSSNDYLGLARSEQLFNRIKEKVDTLPEKRNGSTGSRLLSGNNIYTEKVEHKLAGVFKAESALIFNSGFTANLAVLSTVPQKGDTILYDELSHACIKDGARLSLAKRHPFRHNDLNDLEKKIKNIKTGKIFIVTESVYSMDGDECPLHDLVHLASQYDASLILDEAHSTGVVGSNGSGFTCEYGLQDKVAIRIHTFGKALGVHGACVAGSAALIQYLVNHARPFIYTTALPAHSIASIDCAFDYLSDNITLQSCLKTRISLFTGSVTFKNRTLSNSAIQTIIIPGNKLVREAATTLQQKGLDVRPILSPTVPENAERLRICLHTFNSDEEIQKLTGLLNHL